MKSWRKVRLIKEENLREVEIMVDDLENHAVRISVMKGEDAVTISGESDIQSDVSSSVIPD